MTAGLGGSATVRVEVQGAEWLPEAQVAAAGVDAVDQVRVSGVEAKLRGPAREQRQRRVHPWLPTKFN